MDTKNGPVGFTVKQMADWLLLSRKYNSFQSALEDAEDLFESIKQADDRIHQNDEDAKRRGSPWMTSNQVIAETIEDLLKKAAHLVGSDGVYGIVDSEQNLDLPHGPMRSYWGDTYAMYVSLGDIYSPALVHLNFTDDAFGVFVISSWAEVVDRVTSEYQIEDPEYQDETSYEDEEGDS
jgi:hypothetical protein